MAGDYVTAGATLAGVGLGFGLNWLRESVQHGRRVTESKRRVASALLAEAKALRERYLEVFGSRIKQWVPGQPIELGGYVRATNLFAVYDGNTTNLGLFKQKEAEVIVRAYTLAKAHTESIGETVANVRAYMEDLRTHQAIAESTTIDHLFEPGGREHQAVTSALKKQLREYIDNAGSLLQRESERVLSAGAEAIKVLEGYANIE